MAYVKVEQKQSVSFNTAGTAPREKTRFTWETPDNGGVDDETFADNLFKWIRKHTMTMNDFIKIAKEQSIDQNLIDFTINEIQLRVSKNVYLRDKQRISNFDSRLMVRYLYCKVVNDLINWGTGKVNHSKWDCFEKFIRQSIQGDLRDFWCSQLHIYSYDVRYDEIEGSLYKFQPVNPFVEQAKKLEKWDIISYYKKQGATEQDIENYLKFI